MKRNYPEIPAEVEIAQLVLKAEPTKAEKRSYYKKT